MSTLSNKSFCVDKELFVKFKVSDCISVPVTLFLCKVIISSSISTSFNLVENNVYVEKDIEFWYTVLSTLLSMFFLLSFTWWNNLI